MRDIQHNVTLVAEHPEWTRGAYSVNVHEHDVTIQGDNNRNARAAVLCAARVAGVGHTAREWTDERGVHFDQVTVDLPEITVHHIISHPHVYEVDDDTRRCVECHQLQGAA